jgi:exosortase
VTKSRRSQLGLSIFLAVSLLAGWRPLAETFTLAARNDEYTHILLIFPISAFLIYLDRRLLRDLGALNGAAGSVFLSAAALSALCVQIWRGSLNPGTHLFAEMICLVLWWIGSFVLWFGLRAAREAAFPLCFLLGMAPIPPVVVSRVIEFLQESSAWAAHALFWICGVPVDQVGIFLTIPGLTIQVAKECSSIRSSSMLVVTTLVLAQILLRSPWRKVLVIAAAVPLSIAKNGLRIWMIAMLGTRVNPDYLTGSLHRQGGVVFFAAGLIIIIGLLWLMRRGEEVPVA